MIYKKIIPSQQVPKTIQKWFVALILTFLGSLFYGLSQDKSGNLKMISSWPVFFSLTETLNQTSMKNLVLLFFYLFVLTLFGSLLVSCQVVGDIFGAGVYTGIFLVVIVVVVIIAFIAKMRRK